WDRPALPRVFAEVQLGQVETREERCIRVSLSLSTLAFQRLAALRGTILHGADREPPRFRRSAVPSQSRPEREQHDPEHDDAGAGYSLWSGSLVQHDRSEDRAEDDAELPRRRDIADLRRLQGE